MDQIIEALKKAQVSVWRLTRTRTRAAELYFIRKKLDIPRFTETEEIRAEIFRDFEEDGKKYRGSTEIYFEPGLTSEETQKKIRSAYYAASFVKNPYYELPPKTESAYVGPRANFKERPLSETAGKLADVLLSVNSDDTAFVNSAEIFVRSSDVEIRDSNGTHVSYGKDSIWGEFVTQCVSPSDVEQYRQFSYGDLDTEALRKKLQDGIEDVRLRAAAVQAPKAGSYNVILTGENLRELLKFYKTRSDSSMIYPQYSTWKTGDPVQGEITTGEKLNISLSSALPFSAEGIPLRERPLIRDGILCTIHGNARFAYYLGIEPVGSYEKMVLDAWTISFEEMKKGNVLEAVSFSDFQMDEMDGHFAGELRLGLLRKEDGTCVPVTGGSINGSILKTQGRLIFSKERYKDSSYEGPLAVLIPDVTVAGE